MLSASFFLASCSQEDMLEGMQENMNETVVSVKMRNFAQAEAKSFQSKSGEIESISNEVPDTWTSTVFKVVEGQMVPCDDCDINDFEITGVFLRQGTLSENHTFLYRNNSTTNATHTFTGEDIIGIDMNYNGEYVRMSDIDVFSEEYREQYYSSLGELGVGVFANESTGMTSAVYNFPILSNEDDPGNSLSGMWMRIVLDFNQGQN